MARPEEKGLKYFPFDVDFFNDEKIEAISGEFGIKGEIVAVKLLCAIYRNGYYIEWSELYKMKFLRNLPGISSELLDTIIKRLVKWSFFDKDLFDTAKVLTSVGIQRRYFEAVRRRKLSGTFPYIIEESTSVGKLQQPVTVSEGVATIADDTPPESLPLFPDESPSSAPPPSPSRERAPSTVPCASPQASPPSGAGGLSLSASQRSAICKRFALTPEQLQEKLSLFLADCEARETVHTDRRDAINHFNDWLRKVLDAEKENTPKRPPATVPSASPLGSRKSSSSGYDLRETLAKQAQQEKEFKERTKQKTGIPAECTNLLRMANKKK